MFYLGLQKGTEKTDNKGKYSVYERYLQHLVQQKTDGKKQKQSRKGCKLIA